MNVRKTVRGRRDMLENRWNESRFEGEHRSREKGCGLDELVSLLPLCVFPHV